MEEVEKELKGEGEVEEEKEGSMKEETIRVKRRK
jgi:hypothetical protein